MGCTKTFCQCRGVSINQLDPSAKKQNNLKLKENAVKYLSQTLNQEEIFTQSDVGDDYLGSVTATYLNVLQAECSGATGHADQLMRLNTMAAVVSEMWRIAAETSSKLMERDDEFHLLIDVSTAGEPCELIEFSKFERAWTSLELKKLSLAEILMLCFTKTLKEYEKSHIRNDLPSVKHYAAAMGDILNEMIDIYRTAYLVNYPPAGASQADHHENPSDAN